MLTKTDLTEEKFAATMRQARNDAGARAELRYLRALILFAQAEPEFFPPGYDEDTGEIETEPQRNWGPASVARKRAEWAMMENSWTATILTQLGWTEETVNADWDTMLRLLPLDELKQRPWKTEPADQ